MYRTLKMDGGELMRGRKKKKKIDRHVPGHLKQIYKVMSHAHKGICLLGFNKYNESTRTGPTTFISCHHSFIQFVTQSIYKLNPLKGTSYKLPFLQLTSN